MAMSATTLFNELKAMPVSGNSESDAAEAWAEAFATYFEGTAPPGDSAVSNAIPVAGASIPAAKAAMKARLITKVSPPTHAGIKTAGATALQAGILEFWNSLVAATPPLDPWPTVTLIVPPVLLAGLGAALQTIFTNNKNGSVARDPALTAIANKIHEKNLGGLATWPIISPPPLPIT